jgi:hypothetical protein
MDEMCGIQIDINKAIFKKREKCKPSKGEAVYSYAPSILETESGGL